MPATVSPKLGSRAKRRIPAAVSAQGLSRKRLRTAGRRETPIDRLASAPRQETASRTAPIQTGWSAKMANRRPPVAVPRITAV